MHRIRTLLAALSLLLAAPAAGQSPEPFSIADDLYWVGSDDLASYLFTSSAGHILIDAPLGLADLILDNIRRLGFDPADIEVLLASHAHFDHVGDLGRLREVTGARVILSRADGEMVAAGGRGATSAGPSYPPLRADRTIGHGESVTVGAWTLTAQLTPGHTPGCTSWSGEATIGVRRVSFVSVCSLSVLQGYRLVGDDATYPGMGGDYCGSVAALDSLRPDVFLAPHASFFRMEEKRAAQRAGNREAFVDPEGYRAYLDRSRAAIDRTLEEQGQIGGCARLPPPERPLG
jgi:metallo-beta-lactamase class B